MAERMLPHWPYRDWVVSAINEDLAFDQFTIEQLAGDLLDRPTRSQRVATGFHRSAPLNLEMGVRVEEARIQQVIDRVNTTSTVWLGTTLACAQCHDHKFDPISQTEYFEQLAFFNNDVADSGTLTGKEGYDVWPAGKQIPYTSSDRLAQWREAWRSFVDRLESLLPSGSEQLSQRLKTIAPERD
jgi:hypothetical protein